MIDFSELALAPNESRAARNFFGLSQAQAAEQSSLPAHKLKRFETGNYVPDAQFLQELREFYEGQGYNFHDEDAPGAKAKARGDVVPAGVAGKTDSAIEETSGSPPGKPEKQARTIPANLQFVRIDPGLDQGLIDRIFDTIEANEDAIREAMDGAIDRNSGLFFSGPSQASQAQHAALQRRLAENGLLFARLLGRDPVPVPAGAPGELVGKAKTHGDLMGAAMGDVQRAVIHDDKASAARRKGRPAPTEVFQALVG